MTKGKGKGKGKMEIKKLKAIDNSMKAAASGIVWIFWVSRIRIMVKITIAE